MVRKYLLSISIKKVLNIKNNISLYIIMENNNKYNDFSSNEARKARNDAKHNLSKMLLKEVRHEQKQGSYTTARLSAINRQNRALRAQILTGYEKETEKERLNFARDLQYMAYPMNYTRGTKAKWML